MSKPVTKGILSGWDVELTSFTYKIGCWNNVTNKDIELIIKTYNKINK